MSDDPTVDSDDVHRQPAGANSGDDHPAKRSRFNQLPEPVREALKQFVRALARADAIADHAERIKRAAARAKIPPFGGINLFLRGTGSLDIATSRVSQARDK